MAVPAATAATAAAAAGKGGETPKYEGYCNGCNVWGHREPYCWHRTEGQKGGDKCVYAVDDMTWA